MLHNLNIKYKYPNHISQEIRHNAINPNQIIKLINIYHINQEVTGLNRVGNHAKPKLHLHTYLLQPKQPRIESCEAHNFKTPKYI